ncbi:ABC transporter permease [Luteibacter sp. OK325]|uniref:ABC transporter permease n=1 Tax=Luteibacter sp. OK325 TaxID=2135670 RepID=UPI000D3AA103|nr:ABC transporter permease [Luteibacter sp. OK325]
MSAVAMPSRRRAVAPRFTMTRELTLVAVTVGLTVIVGLLNHDFVGAQNLRFMLLNSVVLSLVALGQTLVIAMRGIDLSVAPILGLAAMVCGLLAQTHGLSLAVALPLALCIGLVLGTINGVLVATMDIPPIVVTLGTYSLYSGLTFLYSDGTQVDAVPPTFAAFGNGRLFGIVPLPTPVVVLLVVLALCWYLLRHTGFGRAVLAVGNNAAAAYAAGLPVTWVRIRVYALSGTLAAFAGLMFLCYTGSATVTAGTGDHIELQSIAVSLIGGTAIAGGRGNLIGTVLGSLFLSVVLTALVFLHVPPIWYSAGEGLMILAAVQAGFGRRGARA